MTVQFPVTLDGFAVDDPSPQAARQRKVARMTAIDIFGAENDVIISLCFRSTLAAVFLNIPAKDTK